jgi:hypothetical protein
MFSFSTQLGYGIWGSPGASGMSGGLLLVDAWARSRAECDVCVVRWTGATGGHAADRLHPRRTGGPRARPKEKNSHSGLTGPGSATGPSASATSCLALDLRIPVALGAEATAPRGRSLITD